MQNNNLPKELTYKDAFNFPISTKEARKDILVGGLLIIFLLIFGWILNLGNRLNVVSRLHNNQQPYFVGFKPWGYTFKRGCISFLAICTYLSPSVLFGLLAFYFKFQNMEGIHYILAFLSFIFFVLGVFTLPGCMTVYAVENRTDVLKNPIKAFKRAWTKRTPYFLAWKIGLTSVLLSFLGIFALGVGFIFASVWAWEVVGYVFTIAMYADE